MNINGFATTHNDYSNVIAFPYGDFVFRMTIVR